MILILEVNLKKKYLINPTKYKIYGFLNEKIKKLLHDDAIRENNIKVINKCRNSWGDVGMQYSNYFKGH